MKLAVFSPSLLVDESDYNQIQVVGTPLEELAEVWTAWAYQE
ncbi:MAG: hypothetical protein ACXADS_02805 [Candidatus Thorarchaeota archaeon]|jgi:hypothetical protein